MFLEALRPLARLASAFRSLFASLPLAGHPKGMAGFTYCLERCPAIGQGQLVKLRASMEVFK